MKRTEKRMRSMSSLCLRHAKIVVADFGCHSRPTFITCVRVNEETLFVVMLR